jgi:hypothetical protein
MPLVRVVLRGIDPFTADRNPKGVIPIIEQLLVRVCEIGDD